MAELRRSLEARRRELLTSVHERMRLIRDEHEANPVKRGMDDGEVSEVDIQEDIELGLIQMKAETLSRIDESIARLDAGVYGYCSSCGGEIAMTRLRALPFAVRCLECEAQDEMNRLRTRRNRDHFHYEDRGHLVDPSRN
jgi:DnaK suppressor protein